MAQEYILNWSDDANKAPLTIYATSRNDTSTSLVLFGRGAPSYGEGLQENLLRMLENFANATPPAIATSGQLWYDSTDKKLKVYDGATWVKLFSANDNIVTSVNGLTGAVTGLATTANTVSSVNGLTGAVTGLATTNNVVTSVNGANGAVINVVKLTEVQTISNKRISAYYYLDKLFRHDSASGAFNLDISSASVFYLGLGGNISLSLLNAPMLGEEEQTFVINIRQGATAYSVTWFPSIIWLTAGGAAPALPGANKATEYIFTRSPSGMYGRKGASTV